MVIVVGKGIDDDASLKEPRRKKASWGAVRYKRPTDRFQILKMLNIKF